MKLLTSLLERVAPTVRRDCNYSNLDRVKAEASWNEESGEWTLPDLKVEKVALPATGQTKQFIRCLKCPYVRCGNYYQNYTACACLLLGGTTYRQWSKHRLFFAVKKSFQKTSKRQNIRLKKFQCFLQNFPML